MLEGPFKGCVYLEWLGPGRVLSHQELSPEGHIRVGQGNSAEREKGVIDKT